MIFLRHTPKCASLCQSIAEATFNFVPRSDEGAIQLNSMRAGMASVPRGDAVNAV
jgi:hypothetical protein